MQDLMVSEDLMVSISRRREGYSTWWHRNAHLNVRTSETLMSLISVFSYLSLFQLNDGASGGMFPLHFGRVHFNSRLDTTKRCLPPLSRQVCVCVCISSCLPTLSPQVCGWVWVWVGGCLPPLSPQVISTCVRVCVCCVCVCDCLYACVLCNEFWSFESIIVHDNQISLSYAHTHTHSHTHTHTPHTHTHT
jgi:hypothetical protein